MIFFASSFFLESSSLENSISKIRRGIYYSRCTTGINGTGGKFAIGINNTGGKFYHWHRWYS
jgi:hypothetical protein